MLGFYNKHGVHIATCFHSRSCDEAAETGAPFLLDNILFDNVSVGTKGYLYEVPKNQEDNVPFYINESREGIKCEIIESNFVAPACGDRSFFQIKFVSEGESFSSPGRFSRIVEMFH